ncbi:effector-associated constant component EACC1 [Streptomyces cadmiisoli]|uniref:effector-associated constant component EACC1 n=1 Tax=Streptomyces cadmiisoli TaxID=2184053 RepID=UPI00366321DD
MAAGRSRHQTSSVIEWKPAAPTPGQMGTVIDVLQLITGNGWSAVAFALAYKDWRRTRTSDTPLTISYNGTQVAVSGADAEAVARITQVLTQSE